MNIMTRIFGTPAPAPATPTGQLDQNSQVQQSLQAKSDAGTAPNGTVPAAGATDPKKEVASGLDAFNDLWKTDTTQNNASGQPLFNLSPEQIQAAASKQDFLKDVASAEQLSKIAAGGQDAVGAMLEIMQGVSRAVYAQSAVASTKLIEGALSKSGFARTSDIETHFKKHAVSNSLHEANPIFSSQAAAPIVEGLKQQFITKFPNATPREVEGMIQDYLTKFTESFQAPQHKQQQEKQAKVDAAEDWSKFL